jgi:hypothetical protein
LNIFEEKVNFPNQLLEGMSIESLFVNPIDHLRAVTALSGKEHGQYYITTLPFTKERRSNIFSNT